MNNITSLFIHSLICICLVFALLYPSPSTTEPKNKRLRDYGIKIGILETGPNNAITDVKGVKVGHYTLIKENNIRTGVTAILPHAGNIFQEKVPTAIFVANGFGKLSGYTQVEELGNIETPIILTNTLSVPTAADALIDYTFSFKENKDIQSVNPVVGETNDGWLNDIRGRHIKKEHILEAIKNAATGPVTEGCVGAGTGTVCFGFKGGIGTASRVIPQNLGGYTVGVLVQTNFGGILEIAGAPVGVELNEYYLKNELNPPPKTSDGSCMIVIMTDAPLDTRNLKRLAKRAILGLAKTGSIMSNGSGDYVIAVSTNESLRIPHKSLPLMEMKVLHNDAVTPLFLAANEAVEEAILNSLFAAVTTDGADGAHIEALPINKVMEIIKKYRQQ